MVSTLTQSKIGAGQGRFARNNGTNEEKSLKSSQYRKKIDKMGA